MQAQAPTPSGPAAQQAGGQAGPGREPVSLLLTALGGIPDTALLRACADAAAMRAPLTQVWQPPTAAPTQVSQLCTWLHLRCTFWLHGIRRKKRRHVLRMSARCGLRRPPTKTHKHESVRGLQITPAELQ